MLMTHLAIALNAQIKVVAHSTVIARFHVGFALIARVDEFVLALVVQLIQHGHGAVLCSSQ